MTNEELKFISAANIINLRQKAGMTQAELGAQLNYSDKTVSKWERGESVPDAWVLTRLAELFDVDVDYLLSSHDAWESPEETERRTAPVFSSGALIATVILSIMTAALTAFIICWMMNVPKWYIPFIGTALSAIAYLIMDCIYKRAKHLRLALVILIVSLFLLGYMIFIEHNPWQLFILMAPAIAIAIVSTYISTNRRARK